MESTARPSPVRPTSSVLNGRPQVFTPEELDLLMDQAARFSAKYDLMIYLTYYLALRVTELVSLRPEDFDADAHQITIRAKKPVLTKTYDLPDRLWKKYREWLKHRNPYDSPWVFPHPTSGSDRHMEYESVQGTFRFLCRRAGIEGRRSICDLRRTAANEMASAGDGAVQVGSWLRQWTLIRSLRNIDHRQNKKHETKMKARFSARIRR